jgi:hypothetical protein
MARSRGDVGEADLRQELAHLLGDGQTDAALPAMSGAVFPYKGLLSATGLNFRSWRNRDPGLLSGDGKADLNGRHAAQNGN